MLLEVSSLIARRFISNPLVALLLISAGSCGPGLCMNGCQSTGSAGTITCPANYLPVESNSGVLVSQPFCVSKYEMKILGNDDGNQVYSAVFVADSRSSGTPWVNIMRAQSITECQSLGGGYDLISNAQWQAVAREIELKQSAGNYLNWSNSSTSGANALNRGHSDGTPGNSLAASLDNDPCFGTLQANCADNSSTDFQQKRTHTLSSGDTIWDVAGNVFEWVKGDIAAGPPYEGGNGFISQEPWTSDLNHPEMWGPFGNYTSKNSGQYGGFGFGNLGSSGGAVFRGGRFNDGTYSGVFNANLTAGASFSSPSLGFRCVVVP
jgi:hypothetical protein